MAVVSILRGRTWRPFYQCYLLNSCLRLLHKAYSPISHVKTPENGQFWPQKAQKTPHGAAWGRFEGEIQGKPGCMPYVPSVYRYVF